MISAGLQIVLDDYNLKDQEDFNRDNIRDFSYNFIKENTYISIRRLAGDFLHYLGYNVKSCKGNTSFIQELRRVLAYCFIPHIRRFLKEGKIEKYSKLLYKVIK